MKTFSKKTTTPDKFDLSKLKNFGILAVVVVVIIGAILLLTQNKNSNDSQGKLPVMDMSVKVYPKDQPQDDTNSFNKGTAVNAEMTYRGAQKGTRILMTVKSTAKLQTPYNKSYNFNMEGDGSKVQELENTLEPGRYQISISSGSQQLSLVNFEIK